MDGNVAVIDIVAQVTDNTAAGAASAAKNVGRLEEALGKARRGINDINKNGGVALADNTAEGAASAERSLGGLDGALREAMGSLEGLNGARLEDNASAGAASAERGLGALDGALREARGSLESLNGEELADNASAGAASAERGLGGLDGALQGARGSLESLNRDGLADNVSAGAASAERGLAGLGGALDGTRRGIDEINRKSRLELTASLIDKASKGLTSIIGKGREMAGKAWTVTVGIIDKATAPIRGLISKASDLIGITGIASAALGGLTAASALEASARQSRAETQLATVLRNTAGGGDYLDGMRGIQRRAEELQGETMHSGTALLAGAAEFATYLTDARAIERMMGTLADYAAGMGGGAELSEAQMADYATQLGKALNAEDAAFDGLKKKGFALSEAQEAVLKSSLTSDLEKAAVLSDVVSESWKGLAKEFASTPTGKISQLKNKWGDILATLGKKLEPAVGRLFGLLDSKLPEIGGLLGKGAEWLAGLADRALPWLERGIDGAIGKIKEFAAKLSSVAGGEEFQGAGLFGKARILWDELVGRPFSEWWEGSGRELFNEKAEKAGQWLGEGISKGLLALLGMGDSEALQDGLGAGRSFADGFLKGFDGAKVAEAFKGAVQGFLDAHPLVASLLVGSVAVKGLGAGLGVARGVGGFARALGAPLGRGAAAAGSAAAAGGAGAAGAAGAGGAALGGAALGLAGALLAGLGIASAVDSFKKAGETYNANLEEKITGGVKLGLVGMGAAIGTAIAPGFGTAIGAGIGGAVSLAFGDDFGEKLAGWLDGTGAYKEAAEGLEKAAGAYDEAHGALGGALAEGKGMSGHYGAYMEAGRTLADPSATAGERAGAFGAQAEAMDYVADRYPALFELYGKDIEMHGEMLRLATELAQVEIERAGFQDKRAEAALREEVAEAEAKFAGIGERVQESRGLQEGFEGEIQRLHSALPGILRIEQGYQEADFESLYGDWDKAQAMYAGLAKEAAAIPIGVGGRPLTPDDFGYGTVESLVQGEIGKLRESIGKEQAYQDEWLSGYAAFYGAKAKLIGMDYGGGLEEDLARHAELGALLQEAYRGVERTGEIRAAMNEQDALTKKLGSGELKGDDVRKGAARFVELNDEITRYIEANLPEEAKALRDEFEELGAKLEGPIGKVKELNQEMSLLPSEKKISIEVAFNEAMEKRLVPVPSGFIGPLAPNQYHMPEGAAMDPMEKTRRDMFEKYGKYLAEGGIVPGPRLALVGEDGAEAVIPLSAKRRRRGIELWERAGGLLGVRPLAEGGILPGPGQGGPGAPRRAGFGAGGAASSFPVSIGSLSFEVRVDAGGGGGGGGAPDPAGIAQAIRDGVGGITDEIAGGIAEALRQAFANMPLAAAGG